ncbi:methionine synthase [Saccharopolyspora rhizosphaerae]|uniref:Methionine synthase n=1 Tax=Saccharopolyspora rhizosphaerae TaxID=2492662 RepID=A0A426JT02_9PSEU|nr:methionine synthase [Saccharopolyspora rhizosphaerae]RRO16301.1 methionine synthase [Saccharopolyspora rhizosphaerae]
MSDAAWGPGVASAVGSVPGTDPVEAARMVVGELPELMPVPELPARGVGADVLGRTAGLLVDLAVEVVPSGYRVAGTPGKDHRRAVDLLRWDLDALEQAVGEAGAPEVVKVQAAGPWTLTAGVELARGHRVLTDRGALRDFTDSLTEGLIAHAEQVAARTGSRVVVQLDEPSMPAVLRGSLPTPSGYGNVAAVPEPEVQRLLGGVIEKLSAATGSPVVVHCCAPSPPVELLRRAGAAAISLDASGLGDVTGQFADELGEAWEEGTTLFLGLVPSTEPAGQAELRSIAQPAFDLATRLGFGKKTLAERAVPTPTCGLAGASPDWARRAISLTNDLAKLFADESES